VTKLKDTPIVFATKYFTVIQQEQTIIKDNMTLANLSTQKTPCKANLHRRV